MKDLFALACALGATAASAHAQGPDAGPGGWRVQAGAGTIEGPAFLGAKERQLILVPNISVAYGERFSASVRDGVRYEAISRPRFAAGPVAALDFGRPEDGDNPFRIAGEDSTALRGLGDVPGTAELGGFFRLGGRRASIRGSARQGVGGHEGFVADVGASVGVPVFAGGRRPAAVISAGPRVRLGDESYQSAFFGIDAAQSARSGLAPYAPGSGLVSYGAGVTVVRPGRLGVVAFAGVDRLGDEAARSPLIAERGERDQVSFGVVLGYRL